MKADFLCPKCRGYLSVDDKVIFTIKKKGWAGGLLLLSSKLGEYTYLIHPSYSIEQGEQFDFLCPICHFDFSVEGTSSMAKVLMREDDKNEFFIVFSRKEGERFTYKLSERKVEKSYGEHSNLYADMLSFTFFK